jgi:hypothetical protein
MPGPGRRHGHDKDRELGLRIRQVCQALFGDLDDPILAAALGIPARQIEALRSGDVLPAEALLVFIESTGANPGWLLSGRGEVFRPPALPARPETVCRRN